MELRVDPRIFELFPGLRLGVVAAFGLDNHGRRADLDAALAQTEAEAAHRLAGAALAEDPRVAAWREAYRRFGVRPKEAVSSLESLLRRVQKGGRLPRILPLVDLYNRVSLRHGLPAGAEDLDRVEGDIELTRAGPGEPPVLLLGDAAERSPEEGEVVYRDRRSAICRRFNWREAERTKLTAGTRRAVLVVEALPPATGEDLHGALAELAAGIERWCGGRCRPMVLDAGRPRASLHDEA